MSRPLRPMGLTEGEMFGDPNSQIGGLALIFSSESFASHRFISCKQFACMVRGAVSQGVCACTTGTRYCGGQRTFRMG